MRNYFQVQAFKTFICMLLLNLSSTMPAAASPPDEGELVSATKKAGEAVGRPIGNYTLIDQDGKRFELKDLLGKPVVVSFMFTKCSQICPTITNHIHDAVMASGKDFGNKFTVLTIGFDAENDTQAALRSYGKNFTDDFKNWRFATADKETIDRLSKEIGFYYRKSDGGFAHINLTTIIDREGRVYKQVYGMVFKPEEVLKPIEYSLVGIPPDKTLSFIDRLRLFCYQYDPATGTYVPDYGFIVSLILIPSAQVFMVLLGIHIFRSVRECGQKGDKWIARSGKRFIIIIMTVIRFIHLLSLVVWVGGMTFFSFIAAPAIFKVLPRETAGDVVGEIFPKYWMMGYICGISAFATIILLSMMDRVYPWIRIGLLALMCGLAFYSGMAVGAKAVKVKAEIRKTDDPSKKEMLRAEFRAIHTESTILNAMILILGLIVIFITSYQKML